MATENLFEIQNNPLEIQDPATVKDLLYKLSGANNPPGKRPIRCKKSTFTVTGTENVKVDSWKFADHDYKRPDLPTYARGLFTSSQDGHRIAVRGYDKFFNVNEVNETQWRNIENDTQGPYELSVKENGCIIFISGLPNGKLLVCSKHSTGHRADVKVSHAEAGELWVERHCRAVNKTPVQLAGELYRRNLTAVGELCDDSFEEHVLAYDQTASGIYLHGLNYNLPKLATLPGEEVHKFADSWGFKKAKFVTYNKIDAVQQFLEECAETGTWDGRETEGFVIRCKRLKETVSAKVGDDWFFKYKFEEPYLMYRQWRECTKDVIAGKLPRIRKHQEITEEYLKFARREFVQDKNLSKQYLHNHGIIALREKFLASRGLKGSEIIAMEAAKTSEETHDNVVLVPIATLGCGKTTVALALVHLFGWGHVQNDNIDKQKNKNKPQKFAFEVTCQMGASPVVIADRNNHQRRERTQLMNDIFPVITNAQLVALHWVHEPKNILLPGIREVTRRRVLDRGDNHQTIRAGSKSQGEIGGIMDGFLKRFEGIDISRDPDEKFAHIIDLDVSADSRVNLEIIVTALHKAYPKIVPDMPTAEAMDAAIKAAMENYQVTEDLSNGYTKKQKGPKQPESKAEPNMTPALLARKIEFFQISLTPSDITSTLSSIFTPNTPPRVSRMYNQLLKQRRIQFAFHVTLIHRAAKEERSDIWNHYSRQYIDEMTMRPVEDPLGRPPVLGAARVRLERLVWDNRVMAFVVRLLPAKESVAEEEEGKQAFPCANDVAHITVGTASEDIKPKESNDLLRRWLEGGSAEGSGIHEVEVEGIKVVEGKFGLVMSRGKYSR